MNTPLILSCMYNGLLVATCGFAFVRGGRPERIGALTCLAASAATALVRYLLPGQWLPAAGLVLMIDASVIATFFWLATTTIRFWPIWALGFALSNVLAAIVAALLPRMQLFAFHTGLGAYAYLVLGALALSICRLGRDPDPIILNGSRKAWLERERRSGRQF